MMKVKVSVVIPIYNAELYLEECLKSLISQSLKEIEIICVDDGSVDQSVRIVEFYAEQDDRIRLICQQNQYAGVARNKGLAAAKGEYVIFLDSDDFFDINLLERTYKQGIREAADIVLFGAKCFDTITGKYSTKDYYFRRNYLPSKNVFSRKDIPDKILNIVTPCPWTKLFKREFVLSNGLEFQNFQNSNDVYFVLSALALADRITYVDADLVYYRIGQSTNLQSNKNKNPTLFLQAYEAVYRTLVERGIFQEVEKSFAEVVMSGCIFNLDTVKSDTAREKIYCAMADETFIEMGVLDHPIHYYSSPKRVLQLQSIKNLFYWKKRHFGCKDYNFLILEKDGRYLESQNEVKVSVIIPVYNVEAYLDSCLCSIREQTLIDIEIICVDDGSTDNSLEILRRNAKLDRRMTVCTQRNSGQSVARNEGVKLANGKYLYFMDSDDILDKEALSLLYQQAELLDLDVLYFDGSCFSDDKECREQVKQNEEYYVRKHCYSGVYRGEALMKALLENEEYRVSPCLQLVKRQHFLSNDLWFYERIIHEDNLFNYKCMLTAKKVGHIQKVLFHRRYRPSSTMTKRVTFSHVYGYFMCYLNMQEFYKNNQFSEECESAVLEVLYRALYNTRYSYSKLEEAEKFVVVGLTSYHRHLFKCYVSDYCDLKFQREKIEKTVLFRVAKWGWRKLRGLRRWCLNVKKRSRK